MPAARASAGALPLTYAQWLAPASGGTLDIEQCILWVGSGIAIIDSIKTYKWFSELG